MNALINPEISNISSKLSEENYSTLEASILKHGLLSPIIFATIKGNDNPFILDGHNRWDICSKHRLPYKKIDMIFNTLDDAKLWVINNLLGQRSSNEYERVKMAIEYEEILNRKDI